MKKLKSNAGETLLEALAAILVIGLSMLMVAGAIVSAARVNKRAEDLNTEFLAGSATEIPDVQVTVKRQSPEAPEASVIPVAGVKFYQTQDDYCYYKTSPTSLPTPSPTPSLTPP